MMDTIMGLEADDFSEYLVSVTTWQIYNSVLNGVADLELKNELHIWSSKHL